MATDNNRSYQNKQLKRNARNKASVVYYKNQLKKRSQTIFVGSVAKIEQHFGFLWGELDDDFDEDNMTSEQRKYYEIFMKLRQEIFDNGNQQLNALLNQYDFLVAQMNNKGDN